MPSDFGMFSGPSDNGQFREPVDRFSRADEIGELRALERRLDRASSERQILVSILMDVVGRGADEQKHIAEYAYSKYANQNEMPDVRDVVCALMQAPEIRLHRQADKNAL